MNVPDQLGILTGRVDDLYALAQRMEQYRTQEMERVRGRKPLRFRLTAVGANPFGAGGDGSGQLVAASSIVTTTPDQLGPDEGYVWSVRDLVIEGLTQSATPDIINIRINNAQGPLFWQLNGNSFGVTFGRGEKVLYPGESLFFQNGATFAATGAIKVFGLAENLPAERQGEFY